MTEGGSGEVRPESVDATVLRVGTANRRWWLREVGVYSPLLAHQDLAVERGLAQLAHDGAAGVICVPTGGGKTRIGAELAVRLRAVSGVRTLWLAHKNELVDQAVEALVKVAAGLRVHCAIGRFQAGDRKVAEPVDCVVGSIATILREPNLEMLLRHNGRPSLIVVDECHHAVARTWRGLIEELRARVPHVRLLGLSATPFRREDDETLVLRSIFQDVVVHETVATELIEAEVMAKPQFTEVGTKEVLAFAGGMNLKDASGDFTEAQLTQIAARQARNKLMVDVYLAHRRRWRQTVFFACTIRHCEQIATMLNAAGVKRARAVHGELSRRQRAQVLHDFRTGKLEVLVSAMLLTEGTDLPKTGSVFMARPTRSPILFRQMIGRGMRGPRVGGTPNCNIILFTDTFADYATSGVATRLSWIAGLEGVELALQRLEDEELEAALRKAEQDDPLLSEQRAEARAVIEAELLEIARSAGMRAQETDRALEGWWELHADPARPPVVLPCFRGFERTRALVESVRAAIRERRSLDVWAHVAWPVDSWSLMVRAVAFVNLAQQLDAEPQWVGIEEIQTATQLDVGPGELPVFEEELEAAGRSLLQREVELFIRKRTRSVRNWDASIAELWKQHVTSHEEWKRLVKRSETYFSREEWKRLVGVAHEAFHDAMPVD